MKSKSSLSGVIMLVLCAFFWGTTFIAQSDAMSKIGPFIFSALRSLIAVILLSAFYFITNGKKSLEPFKNGKLKGTLIGGAVCGVLMFFASNLQNIGLIEASAGKAAFITSFYILFVPIIGLSLGKRPSPVVWGCCIIAVLGFYFLNIDPAEGFRLTVWEIMILLCAIGFSFHILACDKYGEKVDPVLLSCIQFAVAAVLSASCIFMDTLVLGFAFPTAAVLKSSAFSIIYSALFSSAIAFTLQIAGQKRVPPTAAVLLMSLESVFAVAAAWILSPAENALTPVQLLGCVLILTGICVCQIPFGKKEKNEITA